MSIQIRIPSDAIKEPDNKLWENRFKIKSSSSKRLYLVARNKETQKWSCSCPGWLSHRKCKHLTAMDIPDNLIHGLEEKRLKHG